jgi:hypothetical protein
VAAGEARQVAAEFPGPGERQLLHARDVGVAAGQAPRLGGGQSRRDGLGWHGEHGEVGRARGRPGVWQLGSGADVRGEPGGGGIGIGQPDRGAAPGERQGDGGSDEASADHHHAAGPGHWAMSSRSAAAPRR